jgi:hypothetical protein
MRATEALEQSSKQLRSPLISHFKQLIETGNQLAKQADTSDQNGLTRERQQLDTLTAEFKQLSATLAPLGEQASCSISIRGAFPTGSPTLPVNSKTK